MSFGFIAFNLMISVDENVCKDSYYNWFYIL